VGIAIRKKDSFRGSGIVAEGSTPRKVEEKEALDMERKRGPETSAAPD